MKYMKSTIRSNRTRQWATGLALAGLALATGANAASNLVDFQFNEGPGSPTVAAKDNNLTGTLGYAANAANEPGLTSDSPSQKAGDTAVSLNGTGYLVVDDSVNPALALQAGPFTVEMWAKLDPNSADEVDGLLGYGGSYKLGLMAGQLVFTAFGVVDMQSGIYLPPGEWHHVAAAWEPGVGVTFYYDGAPTFVAETRPMLAPANHYLGIGAERLDNPFMGSLDRVRIHQGLLTAEQLDTVAATPKSILAGTVVAYNFNESAAPFQNAAAAVRPVISSETHLANRTRPVFSSDTPGGRAGDYSLSFTNGAYVAAPDNNGVINLDSANPNFTAEAWVKFGTLPQARSVLLGYNGPGGAFSFSITSDRKLFVTTYGIADTPSKATVPDDGAWHHVAVVHEHGKEMRVYVDGVLGDTSPYTGGVLVGARTDTTLVIGAEPGLYNPYVGLMDRVRLSGAALAPNQLDYLAIPGVVPGAPTLSIATVIELSWPTIPAGYRLQSGTNVNDPASWSFVTNAPYTSGGKYLYYVPVAETGTFYRLIKPE
jgi:hypothetical protein